MGEFVIPQKGGAIFHHSGVTGIPLPKPFAQTVFLIETYAAGTGYVPEMKTLEPALLQGTRLRLVREPANEFDPLAIRLQTEDGKKIGYVPRRKNEILAHLLDAGKSMFALISKKEKSGDWPEIQVQIFLEDF